MSIIYRPPLNGVTVEDEALIQDADSVHIERMDDGEFRIIADFADGEQVILTMFSASPITLTEFERSK